MLNISSLLRKLAKTDKWQSLFSYSKEHHFKLFLNDIDLTDIQLMFLRYLSFYSFIYMDIALGDVDERITENEIYEDAYIMYRNKSLSGKDKNKPKKKEEKPAQGIQWVFKKNKK